MRQSLPKACGNCSLEDSYWVGLRGFTQQIASHTSAHGDAATSHWLPLQLDQFSVGSTTYQASYNKCLSRCINWGSFSSDGDSIGYVAIVVMVLCGLGLLCVLLWHLREARSQQGLLCSLLPRLLLAVFWCTLSIAVWSSGGIVHFHHYAIAWYLAIYMQFNHPVSVLSLAVLVGVYLQGIAAYNRDEVWQDHTCWHISHSGEVMNSIFSPNDPRKDFRKLSWFQCDMKGQQLPAWWCLPGDMHVRDINCLGDA